MNRSLNHLLYPISGVLPVKKRLTVLGCRNLAKSIQLNKYIHLLTKKIKLFRVFYSIMFIYTPYLFSSICSLSYFSLYFVSKNLTDDSSKFPFSFLLLFIIFILFYILSYFLVLAKGIFTRADCFEKNNLLLNFNKLLKKEKLFSCYVAIWKNM